MPTINFKKADLPFLIDGDSSFAVETGNLTPTAKIPEDAQSLLQVTFDGKGKETVTLGQSHTVKVGLSAKGSVQLTPVFASSTGAAAKLLKTYSVSEFFKKGANAEQVVLCFEASAAAEASASVPFQYSALKVTTTVALGADGGYAYLRALDKETPLLKILPQFFKTMRLPDQVSEAPAPGEAIFLQFGGELRLGAEVSAGYKLAGTKALSVGQLALSEKYDLSIVGKIGLTAGIAGHFSILMTAADRPGWCRVQVRRNKVTSARVAADVNVGFKNELDLPADAHEFLGAMLGVNGKNFLTVFRKAQELSDFKTFETAIDGLAKKYIEVVLGKGFDALGTQAEFKKFLSLVNRVVTSYEEVEDRAITLFDRYFDRLDELTGFLDRIQGLTDDGLATLRKELSPELWTLLSQLTDGDPLGFLLQRVTIKGEPVDSLAELKERAAAVLDLVQNDAHAEIRRVIGLAKQQFGVDRLFDELAKIDTVQELEAVANEKIGLFVTRLVGRTLDSASNLKKAFDEVQRVLEKIDGFSDKLFTAFKEAANSSYKVALHAEYSRASENESLVDVAINLAHPRGADFLARAGKGDFEDILTSRDTDLVRLLEGVFTHRTRRASAFKVNIVGWHLDYRYDAVDSVIVETEQRLKPSENGITVISTETLEIDRKRKRQDESIHVAFLLRALGESAGVVRSDDDTGQYVIDALSSLSASYQLDLTDERTEDVELRDYLAFARDFGLDTAGATFDELAPMLPRAADGSLGKITTAYDVRFGKAAVDALLSVTTLSKAHEAALRGTMRVMLLANYLKSKELHDVAFAYASPAVFEQFRAEGAAKFAAHLEPQVFPVRVPDGFSAPAQVILDREELIRLATLYNIETALIDAIKGLYKVLGGNKISPVQFEKALGKFAGAMKDFDDFDQTSDRNGIGSNTVFVVFDALVRLASGGTTANTSFLRLVSRVNDRDVEKLFLSEAAANAS